MLKTAVAPIAIASVAIDVAVRGFSATRARRSGDRRRAPPRECDLITTVPPLDGLRVIDLTRVVAGPFCTMMLGDMGAEVLKIEEPAHGDDTRAWAPFIGREGSFFLALNRSKKSVAIDLKTPDGAAALRELIATADVLIENFRPGSLAAL